MSDPPKVSEGFYGTGESMLFTFKDNKIKVNLYLFSINFFSSLVLGVFLRISFLTVYFPDHQSS